MLKKRHGGSNTGFFIFLGVVLLLMFIGTGVFVLVMSRREAVDKANEKSGIKKPENAGAAFNVDTEEKDMSGGGFFGVRWMERISSQVLEEQYKEIPFEKRGGYSFLPFQEELEEAEWFIRNLDLPPIEINRIMVSEILLLLDEGRLVGGVIGAGRGGGRILEVFKMKLGEPYLPYGNDVAVYTWQFPNENVLLMDKGSCHAMILYRSALPELLEKRKRRIEKTLVFAENQEQKVKVKSQDEEKKPMTADEAFELLKLGK